MTNTLGKLSDSSAQNLVLIEALRKSRILSHEGQGKLAMCIATATHEAEIWRGRAERSAKDGYNHISEVCASIASQIEAHLEA